MTDSPRIQVRCEHCGRVGVRESANAFCQCGYSAPITVKTGECKSDVIEVDSFSFYANPDAKPGLPYPSDLMYQVESYFWLNGGDE